MLNMKKPEFRELKSRTQGLVEDAWSQNWIPGSRAAKGLALSTPLLRQEQESKPSLRVQNLGIDRMGMLKSFQTHCCV